MVWLKRPGHAPEPTSALFTPRRDGSATASVTGDLDGVETVLVNTEPLGGSTTPTSDPSCYRHAHASAIASSPRTSSSIAELEALVGVAGDEVVGEAGDRRELLRRQRAQVGAELLAASASAASRRLSS